MDLVKRTLYRSMVCAIKIYQKLFLDFRVWGRELIPSGPKIYVTNHITSTDVCWILPVFTEPVHLILGPGYQSKLMARIFDFFEHISARPGEHKKMITQAVEYLRRGEPVGIAPEGNLQELFQLGSFYPGVAAIYRQIRVPLIPMALVAPKHRMSNFPLSVTMDGNVYPTRLVLRGTYCINIGEPCMPDWPEGMAKKEQNEQLLAVLEQRIETLMEDVRVNKFWL